MKLTDLSAIVTGGASGIGKHLVEKLLSKGAKFVTVFDINKVTGEETVKEFKTKFGENKVRFIACDITNEAEMEEAFKEVLKIGRLDVLVNSAGVISGPNVIRINLEGTIRCCQLAKKYMSKSNGGPGGLILNMCSIVGFIPAWDPVYAASKHGVMGYSLGVTECDPAFSGAADIRIAVICPAAVDTPMLRNDPNISAVKSNLNFVSADDVSKACIMAIEDDSKHACCIRITPAYGIDLLPMKTSKEWQTELKIWKS